MAFITAKVKFIPFILAKQGRNLYLLMVQFSVLTKLTLCLKLRYCKFKEDRLKQS